ncbi:hypothetical protein Hbl1158_08140 [Halobaculum sp. CBA1158]|uniref:hypothetical protein n=1 Tax=Halobaculum sp. CBA1158 TaxID=2904243 RepID=UPI001F1F2C76|nr:hypothetical protein [Halobaculum sp. CBA1158]UIO98532.1 hypothetical protein Hbl1158_08140 [Halobaculum sp. CBA1158]
MRVREALGISRRRQRQVSRAMQVVMVLFLGIGIERGSVGIIVNGGIGLAVTFLPAAMEREYDLPMDAGLTLWISTAVFLHALGVVGIPGVTGNLYAAESPIPFWDHLTHALSASVVAAVGYTVARALDEHSDAVSLPPRFMFVFILLFVSAFGVLWEVLEFAVGGLAAVLGSGNVLTQYGLEDTIYDLVFDLVGAVLVATWGTAHLTDVVGAVADRLDARRDAG